VRLRSGGYEGLCVNVAAIDGGVAFNVVPSHAVLTFSFRPWPGADVAALLEEAKTAACAAAAPDPLTWEVAIVGPTGGGKSTLLSLVAKFHIPSRGQILVDLAAPRSTARTARPATPRRRNRRRFG